MRIALAQINPIIGDIAGNSLMITAAIDQARAQGAHLVVFPEMTILGYPPKDLLLKPSVIDECLHALSELAVHCTDIAAIIGFAAPSDSPRGRALYNAAAFCHQGKVIKRFVKSLLPTYDVFDERRYFEPGPPSDIIEFMGVKLGVTICEDLWNDSELFDRPLYHEEPLELLAIAGAQVMINASASPFVLGKHAFRQQLFSRAAKRFALPLLYCNQVGGNDELVFDGNSCAFDATGQLIAHAKGFESDLLIVDLPQSDDTAMPVNAEAPIARLETPYEGTASAYHALVLGLRDYITKCGFKSVVLGLSGGIDSALTAALCVAAIGKDKVRGVAMPSRYSSDHSVDDARDLAQRLGIAFHLVAIDPAHVAMEQLLTPLFKGLTPDASEENVQARLRGVILMGLSNKFNSLLVTTGNKSELAVGYCTLYGDMAGGLAVLCDVPKMMVWDISRWINESSDSPLRQAYGKGVIPQNTIDKAPSAELRPNQVDQDSLPPYPVLDRIIELYVEQDKSVKEILADTQYDREVVLRMVRLIDLNEYKRKQAAPGLKITGRAFGFGRRMPMAQRYDNSRHLGPVNAREAIKPS